MPQLAARRFERRRRRVLVAPLLALLGGVAACASGPSTGGSDDPLLRPDPSAVRDTGVAGAGGVPAAATIATYTTAQAASGRTVFSGVCSACHGRNEFRGPIFALTWMAEPVGHLFGHIRSTMPQDDPGSLTDEEYVSVLAYFLQLNGREAGAVELPVDQAALNAMSW